MSKESCWGQVPWNGIHQARIQLSNLTLGNYSYYVRQPALRLSPPNRKRTWPQWPYSRYLGHVGKPCSSSWKAALKNIGPNKTIQIDKSKISQRKYNGGHPVQGQWVFGSVERQSGRTFLVPVSQTEPPTRWRLLYVNGLNQAWRLSAIAGVRIAISTRWVTCTAPSAIPYTSSIQTRDHTNSESTWHRLKVFLGPYNRAEDYCYRLTHYMFVARCKAQGIPPFLQFLHIIASTNWSRVQLTPSSAPTTWCSCCGHPHTSASPLTDMVPHNTDHL